jgi:chromosome segregation ATPase
MHVATKPRLQSPARTTQVESTQKIQIDKNKKLETDIRDLVSTHIDSMAKVQEAEAENQRLAARLRNSEEELALLADTVKQVEGREQAAIGLLTETETRSQEQLQLLRNSLEAVESAKTKAETDLEMLRQKYGVLEAQLLSTQEQLRLFSLSKRSVDQSMRAHSGSPRLGYETVVSCHEHTIQHVHLTGELQKASSVERDDAAPVLGKGTLQNMAGLLDAFKEIDDLVKSAFHE